MNVYQFENGYIYIMNGQLHREDGPAVKIGNRLEYWLNGKRHREDGPAVIDNTNGIDNTVGNIPNLEYWLNGECINKPKLIRQSVLDVNQHLES